MKQWIVNKPDETAVGKILMKTNLSKTAAQILVSRGLSDLNELNDFFNSDELEDPFALIDMDKAADAVNNAIAQGDKICIYGDYDCDGVTSTAILYSYLEMTGADVICYIPERSEGYGLNKLAIDRIFHEGVSLIITVDNGISATDEAEYIASLGMTLVITDHHQPPEILPKAAAVVDPHRADCPSKFKELAGVGVALKLIAACEGDYTAALDEYSALAAIGTVADIVSLTGENRIIVRRGIENLKNTENYGLCALMEKCSITPDKISAETIAFTLAPRINSAGRFGSPITALNALVSDDESAEDYADELMTLNSKRKEAEAKILQEILLFIEEYPSVLHERVLVLAGKGWHHGVIGIVAAKLMDLYEKPVFLISVDENKNATGSVRSIDGFNVFDALSACKDTLIRFGGHEKAGGFFLKEDSIEAFKDMLINYADSTFPDMPPMYLTADKIIMPDELDCDNIKTLGVLEPFGEGNKEPVFLIPGAQVQSVNSIGKGRHVKFSFSYNGITEQAIIFFKPIVELEFSAGDRIDILATVNVNEYGGKESLSIKVIDYRLSGIDQKKYLNASRAYEAFMRSETLGENYIKAITPSREDCVVVYKTLGVLKKTSFDRLFTRLINNNINYAKMRVSLDIFEEMSLAKINVAQKTAEIKKPTSRVNLEDSYILQSLKKSCDQ